MARCKFCGAKFQSKQGVRAHLKHCEAYQGRKSEPEGTPPAYIGTEPKAREPKASAKGAFDPVGHARQEFQTEEARLHLRQLQAAHRELDAREAERKRRTRQEAEAKATQTREEREARLRAELEAQERRRKEETARALAQKRRELLQRVKRRVVDDWSPWGYTIPAETKARALKEIEQELAGLAVEELPESELILIAEGGRDRIYRPVMEAEDEAKRRKEAEREAARKRKESEAQERMGMIVGAIVEGLEKAERGRQEAEARRRLEEKKRRLLQHAQGYARGELAELEEREDLGAPVRLIVLRRIEEMGQDLTGDEDHEAIEDLVDQILDEALE